MRKWYTINTKPHAEFKVISFLASKKIETFMPKFLATRRHARKVEKIFKPLFPSYVFVNADITKNYRLINSTIGVKNILGSREEPSSLPNSIIDELNFITDDKGIVKYLDKSAYNYGQKVKINEGLFKGNIGQFCQMKDHERVLVLISFLGRKLKINISSLHIAAI